MNRGSDAFFDERGFQLVATAAESREMDRRTIEEMGLGGRTLMELAGAGVAAHVRARTGRVPGRAVVLCGGGNNGGDGYVIARHLTDRGWTVECITTHNPADLAGDAKANHELWARLGGLVRSAEKKATARMRNRIGHATVVVDALFGTGLSRPIEGPAAALIGLANAADHPLKVSVDLPSGVDANTGRLWGEPFTADLTVTFGLTKPGLHQGPGAEHAGEVKVVSIALPIAVVQAVSCSVRLANEAAVAALLPKRQATGHKGSFGHVGVVGGFGETVGAGALAARAALRGGAGLVTWSREPSGDAIELAEVMLHDAGSGLPGRATVVVVGPGLGQGELAWRAVDAVLTDPRPVVLDADALNLIASHGAIARCGPGRILTPHPKEAARLLGLSVAQVQADRLQAARNLADASGGTIVLKGAHTVVASPGRPTVITDAVEPTLAVGGTGDVLAGLIGALVAQGVEAHDAAIVGVWLHVSAGGRAGLGNAQRGVLASEIADAIPPVIDDLVKGWVTGHRVGQP